MTEQSPSVVDNPGANRFELIVDGSVAGFAAYRRNERAVSFTHTEVDPNFEGEGLGSTLAGGALDAARRAGASVLPYCSFIRGYIERHPDYVDLVPVERRAEFDLPS